MNRCINDIFGYCQGTPAGEQDVILHPADGRPLDQPLPIFRDGSCSQDPKTCNQYLAQCQITPQPATPA